MPPTPVSRFRKVGGTDPKDPRKAPHPDGPFAGMVFAPVITFAVLCLLFLLYRRAAAIRHVVAHQLKSWTGRSEGRIRLSEDEGPSATEFVADDNDEGADDDEPLRSSVPGISKSHGANGQSNGGGRRIGGLTTKP